MHEGFYPARRRDLQEDPQDQARRRVGAAEPRRRSPRSRGCWPTPRATSSASPTAAAQRGDRAGADEMVVRLGTLDPVRLRRPRARRADPRAERRRDRRRDAVPRDARRPDGEGSPHRGDLGAPRSGPPQPRRHRRARRSWRGPPSPRGTSTPPRPISTREIAGEDPSLLMALMEIELRSGAMESAREILSQLLRIDESLRAKIIDLAWTLAPDVARSGVCLHRHRGRRRARRRQLHGRGGDPPGVRHPRVRADRGAAEAGRDLRGRRARSHHVRSAGGAGRRLSRSRPGGRGARDCRGPGRPGAVGARAHRPLPPRAGDARRGGPRHADRRSPERARSVCRDRSVHVSRAAREQRRRADPARRPGTGRSRTRAGARTGT